MYFNAGAINLKSTIPFTPCKNSINIFMLTYLKQSRLKQRIRCSVVQYWCRYETQWLNHCPRTQEMVLDRIPLCDGEEPCQYSSCDTCLRKSGNQCYKKGSEKASKLSFYVSILRSFAKAIKYLKTSLASLRYQCLLLEVSCRAKLPL